jgi:tRNA threonylcarbamoyladenosine modification (KEOPS) complex  Pcc1 subunit
MKKTLIILSTFLVFLYACKKEESITELVIPQNDPESKIADLEKSGVKLSKRNLKLADASGKNFVIIQIAANDESTLNSYFKVIKFSLKLNESVKQENGLMGELPINTRLPSKYTIDIYHLVLFKKIDSKYKSYTIKYELQNSKNARTKEVNDWSYKNWEDSALFDDWMKVIWYTVNNSNESVNVAWEYKSCGFCTWNEDGSSGLHAGNTQAIYNKDARRIGANVYSNWRNYSVEYGNY